jgi:hypothetical protein
MPADGLITVENYLPNLHRQSAGGAAVQIHNCGFVEPRQETNVAGLIAHIVKSSPAESGILVDSR